MHSKINVMLAALISLFSHCVAYGFTILPGDVTSNKVKDANGGPLQLISITGAIAYPMGDTLIELISKLEPKVPVLVKFNSPGGSTEQGLKMIEALKKLRAEGRKVYSSVENGDTCGSMCVPIYMQGQRRYAGEGSLLMFHGATQPIFSNVPDFYKTEEILQIFVEAGINKEWLDARRKEGVFTLPGAYWISGRELFAANANVVTHIIPRHVVEEAWRAPIDPNLRPR
jgi:hypothetical protein